MMPSWFSLRIRTHYAPEIRSAQVLPCHTVVFSLTFHLSRFMVVTFVTCCPSQMGYNRK